MRTSNYVERISRASDIKDGAYCGINHLLVTHCNLIGELIKEGHDSF